MTNWDSRALAVVQQLRRSGHQAVLVGGCVRDSLLSIPPHDYDVTTSALPWEILSCCAGFPCLNTGLKHGTVTVLSGGLSVEVTTFRREGSYSDHRHPDQVEFTSDLTDDLARRDFTVNAVYYDVARGEWCDPLHGMEDIRAKRLSTVDRAEKVFGEDGLRLMRLARQAGQLGFSPSPECLAGAKANASLIKDISPERIWTELTAILRADEKYGNPRGHYEGLKVLEETGVLDYILPELALGKNMTQRDDFHKYDVLEHTLRAVLYADGRVRLAALLHDVGKPFCLLRDGNVHEHPAEGARIAEEILSRLKAPKHTAAKTAELVFYHMYDFDGRVRPNKLRRFFVAHAELLEDLMLLKQADYSGCMDDLSLCPTDRKWDAELKKMREEGAPLTLRQLAVSGREVAAVEGMRAKYISFVLKELLFHAALLPRDNTKERLLALAPSFLKAVLTAERHQEEKRGQDVTV